MAAIGFGGRYVARTMPQLAKRAEEVWSFFNSWNLDIRSNKPDFIGLQQNGGAEI